MNGSEETAVYLKRLRVLINYCEGLWFKHILSIEEKDWVQLKMEQEPSPGLGALTHQS